MKDPLEDFIRQHRAAFDDREPAAKNWAKISQQTFTGTRWWNSVTVWRAAALLLLGVCIYLLIPNLKGQQESKLALKEFKDVESFYVAQISLKEKQIEIQQGQEVGLNGFTSDFQQLEAMYQVLKEEMRADPSQKVKDALILNLLVRIDLLNQQLHKIEEREDSAQKKDIAHT